MTSSPALPVGIVGAGVAGLAAALELLDEGRTVHLVDKGRGVGGRLATRRVGGARLDHGAQFFTVRGDALRTVIDPAIAAGVVDVWCHGFNGEDGHPRYYCPDGMTALAKWLAAEVASRGGVISLSEQVKSVNPEADHWSLAIAGGAKLSVGDLIITSPVPQTLGLLEAGRVTLNEQVRRDLEAITYMPTIGALVVLDAPSVIPSPGGIQQTQDDLFSFIADNQQKGISSKPAVTFHANGTFSSERWNDEPEDVLQKLLTAAEPWLGSARVVEAQLKKWTFATPLTPHGDRCVLAATSPGSLVLAGDAFGGPKVEGAFNSGQAAAKAVIERQR